MGWPDEVVMVRHGRSKFNDLIFELRKNETYQRFLALFRATYRKGDHFRNVMSGLWPSVELRELAIEVACLTDRLLDGRSDFDTPLSDLGHLQALETGKGLSAVMDLPDVIYVSPALRTRQTLEGLVKGWPALGHVRQYVYDRLREQEHGLRVLFGDWRVYQALRPMEGLLYLREGEYCYRYPNGESRLDAKERASHFYGRLVRKHAGKRVLAVTHHLTILALRAKVEHWDREMFIRVDKKEKPINCGVTTYRFDPHAGSNGRLVCASGDYNRKLYTCSTGEDALPDADKAEREA